MKKTRLIFLFFIAFKSMSLMYSQSQKINNNKTYSSIPQERIFLHYNTSFLLSGERLYYKIYNLNTKNNQISLLSKIAYVQLIDSKHKVVLKHKIWLDSGKGQGDFFIPTSLNSGSYKIVAYTNWMKNGGVDNFFRGDIFIINPYSINSEISFTSNKTDTVFSNHMISKNNLQELIYLRLLKKTYSNREKVSIDIFTKDSDLMDGDYSISVKKVNEIENKTHTALDYKNIYLKNKTDNSTNKDSFIIPEFRGELIHGKILDSSNKLVSNIDVSLSVPGKNYILKISKTDNNGNFYFILDRRHNSNNIVLQVLNTNSKIYRIVLNENFPFNFKNLTFNKIELNESNKKNIIKRSIGAQIENAYQSIKQDSFLLVKNEKLFYGTESDTYILNNFTRFKTLKETIVEIIGELHYTKNENQFKIHFRKKNEFLSKKYPPMVLLDGVFIQNHNDIIDFNAYNIKQIRLVKEDYIYGSLIFNGLIDIETFNGNYQTSKILNTIKEVELPKIESVKSYFKTNYQSKEKDWARIPDFRNQLLWNPNLKFRKNNSKVVFYTSDLDGKYQISIEGFSKKGKPVSIESYFYVK